MEVAIVFVYFHTRVDENNVLRRVARGGGARALAEVAPLPEDAVLSGLARCGSRYVYL